MRIEKSSLLTVTLAFVLAATSFVSAVAADEAAYVGNKQCKMCHNKKTEGEVWNKWKAMRHAAAYQTLLGDEAKAAGEKRGLEKPPAESPECLKCHVTAYNVEEKSVPAKIAVEDGVQCESCHGPASLHVADAKKFKMAKDASIDMSKNILKPDAKVCTQCHTDESPSWNPERYTLEDGSKAGFDFKQAWKEIAHEFTPGG